MGKNSWRLLSAIMHNNPYHSKARCEPRLAGLGSCSTLASERGGIIPRLNCSFCSTKQLTRVSGRTKFPQQLFPMCPSHVHSPSEAGFHRAFNEAASVSSTSTEEIRKTWTRGSRSTSASTIHCKHGICTQEPSHY